MVANESYYSSFCLKSVSHGALECDSPRRWNIIRGSKKKEVDPPFSLPDSSLCGSVRFTLAPKFSLCSNWKKSLFEPYHMQWAQTLYEVEIARNYSRISKGFLLFEVIEYWKFMEILLASKLECYSIEAIVHWQLQKWEYVWKCTHTSEFTFEIDQWELIAQGLNSSTCSNKETKTFSQSKNNHGNIRVQIWA